MIKYMLVPYGGRQGERTLCVSSDEDCIELLERDILPYPDFRRDVFIPDEAVSLMSQDTLQTLKDYDFRITAVTHGKAPLPTRVLDLVDTTILKVSDTSSIANVYCSEVVLEHMCYPGAISMYERFAGNKFLLLGCKLNLDETEELNEILLAYPDWKVQVDFGMAFTEI